MTHKRICKWCSEEFECQQPTRIFCGVDCTQAQKIADHNSLWLNPKPKKPRIKNRFGARF